MWTQVTNGNKMERAGGGGVSPTPPCREEKSQKVAKVKWGILEFSMA